MRKVICFTIALLMLVLPALANEILVGASFPLLGELLGGQTTKTVHGGMNLLVNTSSTVDGPDQAVWTGGFIMIPSNECSKGLFSKDCLWAENGIFREFTYLRVSSFAVGIKPQQIVKKEVESNDQRIRLSADGQTVKIQVADLRPGQYYIVMDQAQRASRKETKIPIIPPFIYLRLVSHPLETDHVAMIFMVKDPSVYIQDYSRKIFRKSTVDLTTDEIDLIRARYMEKQIGSFDLVRSELSADELQQALWRDKQGLPGMLEGGNNGAARKETAVSSTGVAAKASAECNFTIRFVNPDGSLYTSGGKMTIKMKSPQGHEQSYPAGASSDWGPFPPGDYQMMFDVPGQGASNWFVFRPQDGDVKITIR